MSWHVSWIGTFAITLASMVPQSDARMIKSIIDFFAVGIGLILLSPLFAIDAISIKISSKGPVFFRQERSGLNESDGPVFKIRNAPRIIPILGHFLHGPGCQVFILDISIFS